MAITREHWDRLVAAGKEHGQRPGTPRWKRCETQANTASLVALLRFPTEFLNQEKPVDAARTGKKQFYFEPAPSGSSVDIGIFYAQQASERMREALSSWGTVVCFFDLPSAERVWVVVRTAVFDPAFIPQNEAFRTASGKVYADTDVLPEGGTMSGLSMSIWSDPKDGELITVAEVTGVSITRHPTA